MSQMSSSAKQTHIPLRVHDDILERIDLHLARMRNEEPGIEFTRVDAVRSLVSRGLAVAEGSKNRKK